MHRSKNFHSNTSSARASNAEAERLCCLEIDHQLDFVDLGTGRSADLWSLRILPA